MLEIKAHFHHIPSFSPSQTPVTFYAKGELSLWSRDIFFQVNF